MVKISSEKKTKVTICVVLETRQQIAASNAEMVIMTPVARVEVTSDVLVFDKKRLIDVKGNDCCGGGEDGWTTSYLNVRGWAVLLRKASVVHSSSPCFFL